MTPMRMDEAARAMNGRLSAPTNATVTGVSTDTRTLASGDLFFALRGPNFDGHAFVRQALAGGAIGAVAADDFDAGESIERLIRVDDPRAALGRLASAHRKQCNATVIAVTGSNGKTTTTQLIHHVLGGSLRGHAARKSFNNNIGVPLTLLSGAVDDDYIVVEVGTNAPGEIAALGRLVEPDIAVVLNAGECHLAMLGSREGVAAEKLSLLDCQAAGGRAIVNGDDDALQKQLQQRNIQRLVRFGLERDADVRGEVVATDADGCRFRVNDCDAYALRVPGRHNVYNALAAVAVADAMGIDPTVIADRLRRFALPDMRLQHEACGGVDLLFDGYNANPQSMVAAFDVIAQRPCRGRRVLILGDMFELGEASHALHRRVGESISRAKADLLIAVGESARTLADAAGHRIPTHCFPTTDVTAAAAPLLLHDGDLVLIKGSRGMHLETVRDAIRRRYAGAAPARATAATGKASACSTTS